MRTNVMRKFRFTNCETALQIAHNAIAPHNQRSSYFIERAVIMFDKVHITYIEQSKLESGLTNEGEWKDATISLADLEWHVLLNFANVQVESDVTLAIFIEDHLNECVKSYLDAGKGVVAV